MKNGLLLFIILFSCSLTIAAKQKTLQKVLTLKVDRGGGANGASVAWDPEQQKYYAAMAGNTYFPMIVYNAEGRILSNNKLETMFDVRGLWYNPTTKTLQTNGYNDFGMGEYKTDSKGIPESIKKMTMVSRQPNDQSVGAYDAEHSFIWFYDHDTSGLVRQDMTGAATTIDLHLGVKKKSKIKHHPNSESRKKYNENASVYTGIAHAETGLLNVDERQIELYNQKTGLLKTILLLPPDAPVEPSLNFSYCNGIYWFFDKKKREWRGYQ